MSRCALNIRATIFLSLLQLAVAILFTVMDTESQKHVSVTFTPQSRVHTSMKVSIVWAIAPSQKK